MEVFLFSLGNPVSYMPLTQDRPRVSVGFQSPTNPRTYPGFVRVRRLRLPDLRFSFYPEMITFLKFLARITNTLFPLKKVKETFIKIFLVFASKDTHGWLYWFGSCSIFLYVMFLQINALTLTLLSICNPYYHTNL